MTLQGTISWWYTKSGQAEIKIKRQLLEFNFFMKWEWWENTLSLIVLTSAQDANLEEEGRNTRYDTGECKNIRGK